MTERTCDVTLQCWESLHLSTSRLLSLYNTVTVIKFLPHYYNSTHLILKSSAASLALSICSMSLALSCVAALIWEEKEALSVVSFPCITPPQRCVSDSLSRMQADKVLQISRIVFFTADLHSTVIAVNSG